MFVEQTALCAITQRSVTNNACFADNDRLDSAPSLGRITGSSSIETLVRVGLEKAS